MATPSTPTMLPDPALLVAPTSDRLRADARPAGPFRDELRRIPTLRNALSVAGCYVQTVGVVALAIWIGHPLAYAAAFLLMGRAHAMFAILTHEAAHRLLFPNRRVNDFVGRWLLGFPAFIPIDLYRRGHMAHHREEFGPDEPDIPLYRGYPISRASMRRKLVRDALGITGWKIFRGLLRGLRAPDRAARRQAWSIVAAQAVILGLFWAVGYPWLYLLLWWLPYMTVWRVINRLRSIAEHGGMARSSDRRNTTHVVRQSWLPRLWIVPYFTGWHLAHHVDSGIPMRHLPRYHEELVRSGYVQPTLEHPSYRALWRALAAAPAPDGGRDRARGGADDPARTDARP